MIDEFRDMWSGEVIIEYFVLDFADLVLLLFVFLFKVLAAFFQSNILPP